MVEGAQALGGGGGDPALRESGPALGPCDWPRLAVIAGAASPWGVAEQCTLVHFIYG